MVFFELGVDLAASNGSNAIDNIERSIYGQMLSKTPRAFLYLLDNCIYSTGRRTYVDLFPFYNPDGSGTVCKRYIIQEVARVVSFQN